jgi:ribonuclease D
MEKYARNDTHYLKPLADLLAADLKAKGRLTWHQQSCQQLIADCAVLRESDPDTVWRVKGSHHLSPKAMTVLRELWRWREQEAIAANKPPYFVLTPEAMVNIAIAALSDRGVDDKLPHYLTARRRKGILHAISEGLSRKDHPEPLRRKGRRLSELEKRRLIDLDRRRNRNAENLGIDPTLIASRASLVALAADWDKHESELLPWQRDLLT